IGAGPRWVDQVSAAAATLAAEATHVILHDAARPAVPYTDLEALMEEAEKHKAVALATPVRSTLVEVDEGGNALAYHLPGGYMHLVTPQAFSKEAFLEMGKRKTEIHPSE